MPREIEDFVGKISLKVSSSMIYLFLLPFYFAFQLITNSLCCELQQQNKHDYSRAYLVSQQQQKQRRRRLLNCIRTLPPQSILSDQFSFFMLSSTILSVFIPQQARLSLNSRNKKKATVATAAAATIKQAHSVLT